MAKRPRSRRSLAELEATDAPALPAVKGGDDVTAGYEGTGAKRPKLNPMSDEDFQSAVRQLAQAAESYVDEELAPIREESAKYYKGEPFGDEEEGRSQVVLTEVRDTVLAILPDLLRIFTSGEKAVEFRPNGAEDIELAEQATEVCNHVLLEQNAGFTILHSAFKDALTKKTGIVTWWCEDETKVRELTYSGLTREEVIAFLNQNPNAYPLKATPEPQSPEVPEPTFRLHVRVQDKRKHYRVQAVPPEEFIFDRRARSLTQFDVLGTRQMLPVSELVEMGFDLDEIKEHGQPQADTDINLEATERSNGKGFDGDHADPSMLRVKYYRLFLRADRDGDGIAELRKVQAIGDNLYVLKDEIADEAPFALFCPDPEPHTITGECPADQTKDIQRIKSHVTRATLDSLAQSIYPRTVIVEGQVNVQDAMNKEVGAIIRARAPGMVQDFATPFVGQAALPILEYLDQIKASRTGVTPTSQGLDADMLQSTTKAAVTAQISASQQRTEMMARIFAETGMSQLMRGLLRLITRHQDKPMVVRLRGKYVPIEPSLWDPNMDCVANVALGRGDDATQLAMLSQIAQKQEQVLATLGMSNPLVSLAQYRNTLAKIVNKAGFKNADEFFGQITPEVMQQMQQGQGQGGSDPTAALAQVEMQKVQQQEASDQRKFQLETWKAQQQDDRERDKLESTVMLKVAEMQGKFGIQANQQQIQAMMERERMAMQPAQQPQSSPQAQPQEQMNG
jgi:hypothetical protein